VKVICAWCRLEGKPDLLGEKEPFGNPDETHGICNQHFVGLTDQIAEMARARASESPDRRAA
jgi:hypothetical protein